MEAYIGLMLGAACLGVLLAILGELQGTRKEIGAMQQKLQELLAKVQELVTVNDSVEALLTQLHDMLVEALAQNDPAAVQAVIDLIEEQKQELIAAVAANTPEAPPEE